MLCLELIKKSNKLICQHSMEKFITSDLNELYYQNDKYYEQVDMIIEYAQTLYNILKGNFVNIVAKHLQQQIQKLNIIHLAVKIKKAIILQFKIATMLVIQMNL